MTLDPLLVLFFIIALISTWYYLCFCFLTSFLLILSLECSLHESRAWSAWFTTVFPALGLFCTQQLCSETDEVDLKREIEMRDEEHKFPVRVAILCFCPSWSLAVFLPLACGGHPDKMSSSKLKLVGLCFLYLHKKPNRDLTYIPWHLVRAPVFQNNK